MAFSSSATTGARSCTSKVTRNPNALWVVQQMREAWPYAPAHRFLWFDRDSKFGADVVSAVRDMRSQPIRTAFRSPWQNAVAERRVRSCRRDLLDHVIVLNERHLTRFMTEYVRYYHEDRTRERYANRSANLDMSGGGKQDLLLPSARGPAPSLRGRRLDSDNFVLSEQVSLSQSEPRVTLSPWAALVAWTNICPAHRIANQRADTPSGGKLLLST